MLFFTLWGRLSLIKPQSGVASTVVEHRLIIAPRIEKAASVAGLVTRGKQTLPTLRSCHQEDAHHEGKTKAQIL